MPGGAQLFDISFEHEKVKGEGGKEAPATANHKKLLCTCCCSKNSWIFWFSSDGKRKKINFADGVFTCENAIFLSNEKRDVRGLTYISSKNAKFFTHTLRTLGSSFCTKKIECRPIILIIDCWPYSENSVPSKAKIFLRHPRGLWYGFCFWKPPEPDKTPSPKKILL